MQQWSEAEVIDEVARGPLRPILDEWLRPRLRDYKCFQLLRHEWQLPEELACCGMLLPWIERGRVEPVEVATLLGPAAGVIAETVQALAAVELRSDQREVAPQWRLFLLAHLSPAGAALTIGSLLARLRESERGSSADQLGWSASVAARLGMWEARSELLNRRVMLTDFARYRRLRARLEESETARQAFASTLREDLSRRLEDGGVTARLRLRPVQVYQMVEEQVDSSWGEFVGTDRIDVLADDVASCYSALGVINVAYKVNSSRLRDYIGGPKDNGYQALLTTILFPDHARLRLLPVEVCISTPAMDELNRRGLVAILAGAAEPPPWALWWNDETLRENLRAAMHDDAESMFVFTPSGEPIMLPQGATVLDFAVRVHSDLGVYCRGALVNGRRTLPGQQLACGDICKVLIDEYNVQIDSATLRRTTTSLARSKVRRALQRGVSGADRGREIFLRTLEDRLNKLGLRTRAQLVDRLLLHFCAEHAYERPEAFYQAVARGEAAPDEAIGMVIEHMLKPRLAFDDLPEELNSRIVSVHLGHCCWPAPGAETVAVLVEKKGTLRARVHRAGCGALAGYSQLPNVVHAQVNWLPERERGYMAEVVYEGRDEQGLIFQITRDIDALLTVNITRFEASVPEPRMARLVFTCEAADRHQLDKLVRLLRARPGRRRVEFTIRPLHEHELTIDEPLANPYSPQPSASYPIFVGREAEIRRILDLVGPHGDAHVLIRGPKRIGKSSLLQNLSLYHLRDLRRPPLLSLQNVPTAEMALGRLLDRVAGLLLDNGGGRRAILDQDRLRRDPIETFADYVASPRARSGPERFAVLIDEFGVIESRFEGRAREEQLQMWRGLLSDERIRRHVSFIIAAPDGSAPGIGEICPVVRLEVLSDDEARDLITTPVHAHLEYRPQDVNKIMAATGAHPYYIQLVCGEIVSQLISRLARTGAPPTRQVVPADLVDQAIAHVGANDDAFHHVIADSNDLTVQVLIALARAAGPEGRPMPLARLQQILPELSLEQLDHAVDQRRDLFVRTASQVAIRVGLVAARLRDSSPPALA